MLLPDGLLLATSTERSVRKDRQVIRSSTDLTKCLLEAEGIAVVDDSPDDLSPFLFTSTTASDAALPKAKSRIARAVATLPTRGANPASIMKTEAAA